MMKWRKRKAEIAAYVERGEMTRDEAKAALEMYASVLMGQKPDPPPHLRVVK
jgi:hypothetical protein